MSSKDSLKFLDLGKSIEKLRRIKSQNSIPPPVSMDDVRRIHSRKRISRNSSLKISTQKTIEVY